MLASSIVSSAGHVGVGYLSTEYATYLHIVDSR